MPSRILAHSAPPLSILWIRFLLAGGLLFAGALAARLPMPRDGGTWWRLLLLGIGGNALYLGLNYEALRHLSAGMGAIVASTNPLILALLAPWLLREPPTPRKLAGLLLGFFGVLLAMHTRARSQEARPQDVLLAAGGVLAFVFSNILYKRMRARPHPVVLNAAQLSFAGLMLLPAALLLEGPPRIDWTPPCSTASPSSAWYCERVLLPHAGVRAPARGADPGRAPRAPRRAGAGGDRVGSMAGGPRIRRAGFSTRRPPARPTWRR